MRTLRVSPVRLTLGFGLCLLLASPVAAQYLREAKLVEAERPYAVDLGLDFLAIGRSASHAGHAALRPDLPLRFGEASLATMR